MLEHGKPLIFGAENDKGIRRIGEKVEVVTLGDGVTEDDLIVHDEKNVDHAYMLSQLFAPEFPEPMGVIYADETRPTYNDMLHEQVEAVIAKHGDRDLQSFVSGSNTWTVE